ncbi:helix-turn-helix domain-containing protein [uncultured Dubosiella sp.]|uniref:helix-turn-helix transcriptional regulator n=1 Tax=uncultured Dubosiella sp. TaxID=1937011 RepID=UPI0025876C62|nr:helix-turn-helix domain-containing protein [uncultured Dubosiella sp.]
MKNRIKDIRLEEGLTQDELSKASGVSRTILSGLETGTVQSITTDTMLSIAKALSREVSDIFLFK